MHIDWSINVGTLLTLGMFLLAAIGFYNKNAVASKVMLESSKDMKDTLDELTITLKEVGREIHNLGVRVAVLEARTETAEQSRERTRGLLIRELDGS